MLGHCTVTRVPSWEAGAQFPVPAWLLGGRGSHSLPWPCLWHRGTAISPGDFQPCSGHVLSFPLQTPQPLTPECPLCTGHARRHTEIWNIRDWSCQLEHFGDSCLSLDITSDTSQRRGALSCAHTVPEMHLTGIQHTFKRLHSPCEENAILKKGKKNHYQHFH